jgi:hypothetical protein
MVVVFGEVCHVLFPEEELLRIKGLRSTHLPTPSLGTFDNYKSIYFSPCVEDMYVNV